MNDSEILVTGGTGLLGRRVVDRLRAAGHDPRVLSRSGRAGTVRGDLLTMEGIEPALEGVNTLIHCASSPLRKARQIDVHGTERLLEGARGTGLSHVVFISIVGVDRNPYYPYFRIKLDTERVVERSGVPWTILRATQFHEFVLRFLAPLSRGPVALAPRGLFLQPVDVSEVAGRLVELALADPAGRVTDLGGPEVGTFADFSRAYLESSGAGKRIVEVPVPGKAVRAWREGAQICPEGDRGEITWKDFLRERRARSAS